MGGMENSGIGIRPGRTRTASGGNPLGEVSVEHYLRLILHRKWLVLGVFSLVSITTFVIASRMQDIYISETVIMVDPQKVPDSYVRSTVTGDVRNRLGTLSQQILSATRLQKIIETLNLYPEERKAQAREDVITRMRRDISVQVVSDFGGGQDLQAFRIGYSGTQPGLVAQVTNELASLFIEENLKAREQQATSTNEFLQNQLQETRKVLEQQEAKLKVFKLKHIGEMPEQQTASLQILGQVQSQLQLESEALNRAEQQKSYLQSMLASQSTATVVDLDEYEPKPPKPAEAQAGKPGIGGAKARLQALLSRYSEDHPDVKRLRRQIEDEQIKLRDEGKDVKEMAVVAPSDAEPAAPAAPVRRPPPPRPSNYVNPVLQSQLKTVDAEIAKHKEEQQRLSKLASTYQTKLEAIPVREQEITELVRDYEISKGHYKQLLEKQMSAETATQLEIRQKGERFSVLDPAQPAERPSRPNRRLINAAGSFLGFGLGLLLALVTEFLGMSITAPEQITAATNLPVLGVIPVIRTAMDRMVRRRRLIFGAVSAAALMLCVCGALLYHYRDQVF
jgi:succinoglycan biosynthesis transport protein ExoP